MSAKPWYAWYPADYRAKTAHLSFIEDSAYRRMIDAYYERRSPLPTDRAALYRLCSAMDDFEKKAIDAVAKTFFTNGDGLLRHARCDDEIQKAQSAHERWVEAGRKGGLSSAQGRLEQGIKGGSSNPQSQSHITTTVTTTSPSETKVGSGNKVERVSRATRLEQTELPEEWRAFSAKERDDLNPEKTFEQFRDYWIAVAGSKGRKLDWFATWRNWVRAQNSSRTGKLTLAENNKQAMNQWLIDKRKEDEREIN